ncbi:glutamate racemase [Actimicrobium antarcticum]|uniref:Glutamate racemase n=2 Tax=Actimicrobium antarcticum TaxID=1051899 RepID=A0ABP7TJL8_9BURK
MAASVPIGVFDSGIGGLSVLQHIHAALPRESLLYFSDARHAPYGGRPEQFIEARALAVGAFMTRHCVKALVVACNTATAVAITALRRAYPSLIVVGVEPGLKPAAALTHTKIVGVLATEATLASKRFAHLHETISAATSATFLTQACPGLADRIEQGQLDSPDTLALLMRYVVPLLEQGADTLVLGCTHYPFVKTQIATIVRDHAEQAVTLVDTGAAVARRLSQLLADRELLCDHGNGEVGGATSGETALLEAAFLRLLGMQVRVIRDDTQ